MKAFRFTIVFGACLKLYELCSRMKYNEQVCAAPKAEKV